MTRPLIESIDLLDTEYADILVNSSNPGVEIRLIQIGIDPAKARCKTDFLTLVQNKPQTPSQWQKLLNAWEEAYDYRPNEEHIEIISELVWDKESKD